MLQRIIQQYNNDNNNNNNNNDFKEKHSHLDRYLNLASPKSPTIKQEGNSKLAQFIYFGLVFDSTAVRIPRDPGLNSGSTENVITLIIHDQSESPNFLSVIKLLVGFAHNLNPLKTISRNSPDAWSICN